MTAIECPWPRATRPETLAADALHVWCASTELSDEQADAGWELLSADERDRAGRYRLEKHRHRFLAGRAQLRWLLGLYLGMPPADVRFRYEQFGKPQLDADAALSGLQFNASGSGELAVYAFARSRKIGVDLERHRPMSDMQGFARRYFTPREAQLVEDRSGASQVETFFRIWTCKEALLKALGTGLTLSTQKVAVGLEEPARATLLELDGQAPAPHTWWLELLQPAPMYTAALAWSGPPATVRTWRLEGALAT